MHTWHSQRNHSNSASQLNSTTAASPLALFFLQVVDFGLLGLLFVAPLFLGGRHGLGQFVFAALISLIALSWCVHQLLMKRSVWIHSWSYYLGITAIGLLALQILPLPPEWLEYLAPRNQKLLTLFNTSPNTQPNLGSWSTLSLTPTATRISLAMLVSYCLLFIVAVQRLQMLADIKRLLQWIALSAIAMAGFGLLQFYTSNGLFFWFYEAAFTSTDRVAKGSFTCRNHFAHFLVLGLGPLLAWFVLQVHQLFSKQSRSTLPTTSNYLKWIKTICLVLSLILIPTGVLLSLSRGGILVFTLSISLVVLLFYFRGLLSWGYLLGLAMLGLLVVGLLSFDGYDNVSARVDDFSDGSLEKLDNNHGRRKIWAANLAAIREGSWFGSGAGSHAVIYPVYMKESFDGVYTHAESGYVQIATENGWLGIALLLLGLCIIGRWSWVALRNAKLPQQTVFAGAVVAGMSVSAIHSLFDFVWYVPACVTVTLLLAACLLRLTQLDSSNEGPQRSIISWNQPRWIVAGSLVLLATIGTLSTLKGPAQADNSWNRYRLLASHNKTLNLHQLKSGRNAKNDGDNKTQRIEAMIHQLRTVVSKNTKSAEPHLRLAMRYLQLFNLLQVQSENAMGVEQIREASIASKFNSATELQQWLQRAIGDHSKLLYRARYHALQAIRFSPLSAQAYLTLGKLCFLEGQSSQHVDAYVKQCLLLSPRDGGIIYQVGKEWFASGHGQEALLLWQNAYKSPGAHQLKIIQFLSYHTAVDSFLENFQPDWQTLPGVWQHFSITSSPEQLSRLVEYAKLAAASECPQSTSEKAADIWHKLANIQISLQRIDAAIINLESAIKASPDHYLARRTLGQLFLKNNQFELAENHLRWCRSRRPDDRSLKSAFELASKSHYSTTTK